MRIYNLRAELLRRVRLATVAGFAKDKASPTPMRTVCSVCPALTRTETQAACVTK